MSGCLVVVVAVRLAWLWVCLGFVMSFCVGFFFLINCVGVLGFHGGDGGDERERERERERKLERGINIFYCINILF